MRRIVLLLMVVLPSIISAQRILTPLEKSGFTKLTTHQQMMDFIRELEEGHAKFEVKTIATSVQGREIPVLEFSSSVFGQDTSKLMVLLFAQQHGNEPSGKEGALMLISKLAAGEHGWLLDYLDIAIVPMMNPDGNEVDRRRNGNGADLNRSHLVLDQPETIGLHKYFNENLFHVSMDVHEYSPFSSDWMEHGYRKNSDITAGRLTNINTPQSFRDISDSKYLPFLKEFIQIAGYTYSEYTPGGPPEIEYIRHSTYDINDGRQSIGSQGTLSFIQEGMNGKDSISNIERRSKSQMIGMQAYLTWMCDNALKIKPMVESEREKIISGFPGEVAIQMEHRSDGRVLEMPVLSLKSGKDTVITVKNYRPVVASIFDVKKPAGYLIPAERKDLIQWTERHGFTTSKYKSSASDKIEEYTITAIDSIDFEGDIVINPSYTITKLTPGSLQGEYHLLSTKQLAGNVIVQALEPKSIIGLATYKKFEYLVKKGEKYPVLRLIY